MQTITIKVKNKLKVLGFTPINYDKKGNAKMFLDKKGQPITFKTKEEAKKHGVENISK